MVLDNLAVSITSQVTDVQQGIRSVRGSFVDLAQTSRGTSSSLDETGDELTDVTASSISTSAALSILANRLDDVDDELDDTRNSAAVASGALTSFGISSEGASLGVTSLSTSLTAALIPALVLLSTTLAPITAIIGTAAAGVAALAGAFGLVIGSGVIAGLRELRETFESVRVAVGFLLREFGQQFAPILVDILEQVPFLVNDILQSVGGLTTFGEALRSGFQTVRRILPQVFGTLAELAADALPVVRNLITFLINNGPSIFRAMVQTTRDLAPQILEFTDAVIDAAPALLGFGTFVFETVVPALTLLIDRTRPAINAFLFLLDAVRLLDARFRRFAPFVREGFVAAFKAALDPIGAVRDAIQSVLELWTMVEDTGFGEAIQDAIDVVQGGMGGEFVQRGVPGAMSTGGVQEVRLSGNLQLNDEGELVARIDERAQTQFAQENNRLSDRADRIRPR